MERRGFYVPVATPDSQGSGSSDDEEGLPSIEVPVQRSSRIQQQRPIIDTPMLDAPQTGRFVIVPPTLTAEQRREYLRYEEDDEGNLL